MRTTEIEVTDRAIIPRELFHLVPKELFSKYLGKNGDYDCRKETEWGMNSDFIHTTSTRKDLKEKVADQNWKDYPQETAFLLLKVNTAKIKSDFTYAVYDGTTYYHIWGPLPKDSFEVIKITRNVDGSFNI